MNATVGTATAGSRKRWPRTMPATDAEEHVLATMITPLQIMPCQRTSRAVDDIPHRALMRAVLVETARQWVSLHLAHASPRSVGREDYGSIREWLFVRQPGVFGLHTICSVLGLQVEAVRDWARRVEILSRQGAARCDLLSLIPDARALNKAGGRPPRQDRTFDFSEPSLGEVAI